MGKNKSSESFSCNVPKKSILRCQYIETYHWKANHEFPEMFGFLFVCCKVYSVKNGEREVSDSCAILEMRMCFRYWLTQIKKLLRGFNWEKKKYTKPRLQLGVILINFNHMRNTFCTTSDVRESYVYFEVIQFDGTNDFVSKWIVWIERNKMELRVVCATELVSRLQNKWEWFALIWREG